MDITEEEIFELKDFAKAQFRSAVDAQVKNPEGIAILMADGTIFEGRRRLDANAAQDALSVPLQFASGQVAGDLSDKFKIAAIALATTGSKGANRNVLETLQAYVGLEKGQIIHGIICDTTGKELRTKAYSTLPLDGPC